MEIRAIIESLIFALIVGYKTNYIKKKKTMLKLNYLKNQYKLMIFKMIILIL